MTNRLVIVESPTKAKTIKKFLGKEFTITSSFGHIRDLPNNASEVPPKLKKEKWATLGVNVQADFEPLYVVPQEKKKQVNELKQLLKDASELLLATDEDREGESISWHLLEVLKPDVPVHRMVFHEITAEAIHEALKAPREIDLALVRAQETRRIVDRLFGYEVSPLLWKKVKRGLSAGRVQSVAMRLLVQRERERIAFRSAAFWGITGIFRKEAGGPAFEGELTHLGEKRVASGKDFNPQTGKLDKQEQLVLLSADDAARLCARLAETPPVVQSVDAKPMVSRPYPPFTTSTLQQEASRKFRFSAQRTMKIAQMLYENGLITYMRTDSTNLSEEALRGARAVIERDFGREFLPDAPRTYKTQVKNAQEAHEAIRPAGADFTPLEVVKAKFGAEASRLYELIWKRTIASQMKDSHATRITVVIQCDDARFRASGKTIQFAGYLRAYVEGSDDPEAELADQERILPKMEAGDPLKGEAFDSAKHETQPPARYTEGSLIKELERLGIGRPSTWASIVGVILSREYAFKKGNALVPTFLACALTSLMERFFSTLVDYGFTAGLEDDLDTISRGESDGLAYLRAFYFGEDHLGLRGLVDSGEKNIDPREVCGVGIGTTAEGKTIEVRIGRYGAFVSDGEARASLPPMIAPDELTLTKAEELLRGASEGPAELGPDPASGQSVFFYRNGPFGPYVQLGEGRENGEKPKTSSLLPGMSPDTLGLEQALQLLSLPRTLGTHPDTGTEVIAANGRFGPYIKAGDDTRSIPAGDLSPLTITLEQAVALLREPKRRAGATSRQTLRALGKHPVSEKEVTVKNGRFGPYVTDGAVNASLPKGMEVEAVTMDDAVNLLEARAAKLSAEEASGVKKRSPRKRKAKGATKDDEE